MAEKLEKEFLDFQSGMAEIQSRFKTRGRGLRAEPGSGLETAQERLKNGLPCFTAESLEPDPEFLEGVFREIASLVRKHAVAEEGELERFDDLRRAGGIDLAQLVRKMVAGDAEYFNRISAEKGLPPELLVFFAENLARVFLSGWAEGLPAEAFRGWLRGYCPVCGNEPRISKIEPKQGKRILSCSLCGTLWVFRRVECPYCGNVDSRQLRFFQMEEGSPYRVDVCEKCRRYIKSVDERKTGKETVLSTIDVITGYLDEAARKEGYLSGPRITG